MKESKIQELLESLNNLKVTKESRSMGSWTKEVIDESGRDKVESVIRKFLLDNRDVTIATLEAKVFLYEEIIKKSTFAPILDKTILKEEKKE